MTTKRSTGRSRPKTIYGHEQPRVFTPPLRPLTPRTSAGFAAIQFADWMHEQVKGTRHEKTIPPLLPWERWLLIHALELLPDNTYRFKILLLWIARQNGKTFIAAIIILFRMFIDGDAICLGVAQKLSTAKKPWEMAKDIIAAIPRLQQEYASESKTNGELWFELSGGQRYWVDSADNGGLGLTFDLVFVDEILKHKNFTAWSALSKTTMARSRSQIIAAGNTGGLDALVQRHFHDVALSAIKAEDRDARIGLFWWSPPEGAPSSDPETWAYSNPSMGHVIAEADLRASWSTDPAQVFTSEVMNLFLTSSTGGPFQQGMWEKALDRMGRRALDAPVYVCIEVSHNRQMAHIGFAALRDDGRAHVGIMRSRPGTDWVVPWLTSPERQFTPAGITFQTKGATVSSLLTDFTEAGLEVTEWGGADLGRWTGLTIDGVNNGRITRRNQPVLDVPAGNAVMKKLGDGYAVDRHGSPGDASPLSAVIGAYGLLRNPPEAREPQIRVLRRRRGTTG